jgi:hypothetical protein
MPSFSRAQNSKCLIIKKEVLNMINNKPLFVGFSAEKSSVPNKSAGKFDANDFDLQRVTNHLKKN